MRYDHGVYGLKISIQSAAHGPAYLEERIEAFLATVHGLLSSLSAEAFANHRDALVKMRLDPPKTLRDETSLYWSEITNATYDFARDEAAAAAAAALTQADLVRYWAEHFDATASNRRKLSSHAYGPWELGEKLSAGVAGRGIMYVDGLEASLKFRRTLKAFEAKPREAKAAC